MSAQSAQHGAAYELHTGEDGAAPVYVVGCNDPSDNVFQHAANLLQERLAEVHASSSDVQYTSTSMHHPEKEYEDIAQLLNARSIFEEYQHFRVALVPGASEQQSTLAVGIGTSNKKLERAAKLALAVALAMQTGPRSAQTWLSRNDIQLFGDPLRASSRRGGGNAAGQRQHQAAASSARPAPQMHKRAAVHDGGDDAPGRLPPRMPQERPWSASGNKRPRHSASAVGIPPPAMHKAAAVPATRQQPVKKEEHLLQVKQEFPDDRENQAGQNGQAAVKKSDTHLVDMSAYLEPPDPWSLIYDFDKGSFYYWNADTSEAQWKAPPGSKPASKATRR